MIACYKYTFVVSMCVVQVHFWSGTRLVLIWSLISTSWFLILANAFRNGYVFVCSTASGSAAEMNEISGYGTVPCLAKMTHHSSPTDWILFIETMRAKSFKHFLQKRVSLKF